MTSVPTGTSGDEAVAAICGSPQTGRVNAPIRVPQFLTDAEGAKERSRSVVDTYRATNSISKTAFSHGLRKHRVKEILKAAGLLDSSR